MFKKKKGIGLPLTGNGETKSEQKRKHERGSEGVKTVSGDRSAEVTGQRV